MYPHSLYLANGPSFAHYPAHIYQSHYNTTFNPTNLYHTPLITEPNNKEWFGKSFNVDYLLSLAHQKYNRQDYVGSLGILQDLYQVNPRHLAVLLLLGCTCYSLQLYPLSIHYNQLILSLDPQFAEAYSNLGTTHRALAQPHIVPAPPINLKFVPISLPMIPSDPIGNLDLAEKYYKTAISLRPGYWDANINLAGLLCSKGQLVESLHVYLAMESLMESEFAADHRFDLLVLGQDIEADCDYFLALFNTEQKRRHVIIHAQSSGTKIPAQEFTPDRRRDFYFAKANLYCSLNDFLKAKQEYFKGLAAIGLDISHVYLSKDALPLPLVSPEQANMMVHNPPVNNPIYHTITSSILQSLAKMYQDVSEPILAIKLYYVALGILPTSNTCNNLGILLAPHRIEESIRWYEFGLSIDPGHVHLYTNLGSALKDRGQLEQGLSCYQRAISIQPDFYIALANLANVYKDLGRIEEAVDLYRRALVVKPSFTEAFCNFVNSLLFICDWRGRTENLERIREITEQQLKQGLSVVPYTVPTVLPFHTFTYASLSAWMVREISRRNANRVLWNVLSSGWFPGFPKSFDRLKLTETGSYPYPYPVPSLPDNTPLRIGYVSSDFTNHPLAHLMQSVFGFHDRKKFKVYCYSLSANDHSPYRATIERNADVFVDVSSWSTQQIVEHIAYVDQIHILCNLNGYTKGGKNEIFAARPCAIQISLMGFANTMGAGKVNDPEHMTPEDILNEDPLQLDQKCDEDLRFFSQLKDRWIDYFVVDEIACPRKFVCGEPLEEDELVTGQLICRGPINKSNDANRIYTEGMIYLLETYFVNDHKQGFREAEDPEIDTIMQQLLEMPGPTLSPTLSLGHGHNKIWRTEQLRRLRMRREMFPDLPEDYVIFANFNQLYKIDPNIFATWMQILKRIPRSILWLLRFPPVGEKHLKRMAFELVGEEVASRVVFTGLFT